ncbi:hypothetical protein DY000_02007777 [Brassica cretica]|uniref:DUF641 domain-containing protein n=1 Tax=Brassica cretica TaxID=69181 RepID=A0ABQ7CJL3_BRACR|nr:hypothetical protein DY000_02007777 [Brassica cretica]
MDFARPSIDNPATTSSDESTEKSVDTAHQTSIDDTSPEADYINPGRTYSNRSAIKLPKDDTKKSGVSLEYLFMSEEGELTQLMVLAKINESLDSFHSVLEGQNQFGICKIDYDTLSELEHQVDFVDTQTLKNKYPIPIPDSFTQSYDATVGTRRGRSKFSELMRKFDALSEHIKRVDGQVAENATTIKREAGRLHGRTDANPKRQVNAVLLRSRKCLIPSTIEINNAEKHAVVEETGENRSRPIILNAPNTDLETPREKELSNTEEAAIALEEEEERFAHSSAACPKPLHSWHCRTFGEPQNLPLLSFSFMLSSTMNPIKDLFRPFHEKRFLKGNLTLSINPQDLLETLVLLPEPVSVLTLMISPVT